MAAVGRNRGYGAQQELNVQHIIQEAQVRWLKPLEVCEILRNYEGHGFKLNQVPPVKPQSGSLFLFDRKALRFFRKDGHNWRKKKDGKTVREAHERLKAGSVDVLHCYYAHGEDDSSFQRRSYWMLEGAYEHIVLVHYLHVEGKSSRGPSVLGTSTYTSPANGPSASPALSSMSPDVTISSELDELDSGEDLEEIAPPSKEVSESQPSLLHQLSKDWSSILAEAQGSSSSSQFVEQSGQAFDDLDDLLNNPDKYLGPKPLTPAVTVDNSGWNEMLREFQASQPKQEVFQQQQLAGNDNISWQQQQQPTVQVKEELSWQQTYDQVTTPGHRDAFLGQASPLKLEELRRSFLNSPQPSSSKAMKEVFSPRGLGRVPQSPLEAQLRAATEQNALRSGQSPTKRNWQGSLFSQNVDMGRASQPMGAQQNSRSNVPQPVQAAWQQPQYGIRVPSSLSGGVEEEDNLMKKTDSFGRWLTQTLAGDDSPGALVVAAPSDSGSFWMPDESSTAETPALASQMQLDMSISISHVQRFSITDFSPDNALANEEVKVLVSGRFLESINPPDYKWCCMFGDVEVEAEHINPGVLRCKAPPHTAGRVPFYVTCSDRLACSEVREFEFRAPRQEEAAPRRGAREQASSAKELHLQLRILKMLFSEDLNPNSNAPGGCDSLENDIRCLSLAELDAKEQLLELCFKHQLQSWLATSENPCTLDEHGQGLLHLASALGYDWAIKPILAAGVVPNFRDVRGWSALHWAATFGREKTVLALLAAGTSPSLMTDPTTKHPNGQMASELASACGHKGIAGYLAEKALTSHLSSLTIAESNLSELNSVSASLEAENAVESVAQQTNGVAGESAEALSAVRKATTAAALIHSAYRIDSFRKRNADEEGGGVPDEYGMLPGEIHTIQRAVHRGGAQRESAALQIQKKFRGWKGRKEFLNLRKHVVRIQAHVRGHQARKRMLRVVSVVEKAVLRWRRKKAGLRGWQQQAAVEMDPGGVGSDDDEDFLRDARKQKESALGKAMTRVLSMASSEEGRQQYRRMVREAEGLSNVIDDAIMIDDLKF